MKTDIINEYIKKRLNLVIRHIKAYEKNEKSEHLHQIRVNIKKIKAILSFVAFVYEKKYKINKIRKLFHKAGEIREIQININLLKSLQNPPDTIIVKLQLEEKFFKESFLSNISNYLRNTKKIRKDISLPSLRIKKRSIKKYIHNEFNMTKKEFTGNDRTNMHLFRKRLKKIMYIYKALSHEVNKKFILDSEYINELQEKAGEWHDSYVALEFLNEQSKSNEFHLSTNELRLKENELLESLVEITNFDKIIK